MGLLQASLDGWLVEIYIVQHHDLNPELSRNIKFFRIVFRIRESIKT